MLRNIYIIIFLVFYPQNFKPFNFFLKSDKSLHYFWHLQIPTLKMFDQKYQKNIKIVILDTNLFRDDFFLETGPEKNTKSSHSCNFQSKFDLFNRKLKFDKSIEGGEKRSPCKALKNTFFTTLRKNHGNSIEAIIKQIITDVDIISVPILNEQGFCSKKKFLQGLSEALKLKPDILYLGLKFKNSDDNQNKTDKKIMKLLSKFKYVVAAAGNDGETENKVAFPAAYKEIFFSVGAFQKNGDNYDICDFSQFEKNKGPNFVMPGKDIFVKDGCLTSGTSAAGALFAGCLACVLQLTDKHFSPTQIKHIIQNCCVKLQGRGWNEKVLFGTPDMKKIEQLIFKLKKIKNTCKAQYFQKNFDCILNLIIKETCYGKK